MDIFIPGERPFDRVQFERRVRQAIDPEGRHFVALASAEDVILAKLEWYRKGDEVSERQWHDVIGIIRVQGQRLDLSYLRRWAVERGVLDLLERALGEAL